MIGGDCELEVINVDGIKKKKTILESLKPWFFCISTYAIFGKSHSISDPQFPQLYINSVK